MTAGGWIGREGIVNFVGTRGVGAGTPYLLRSQSRTGVLELPAIIKRRGNEEGRKNKCQGNQSEIKELKTI